VRRREFVAFAVRAAVGRLATRKLRAAAEQTDDRRAALGLTIPRALFARVDEVIK
jgi:hypothetical protein